jgi:hypothetical protein
MGSFTGPNAIAAARALLGRQSKGEQWPYDWSYPPPRSQNVDEFGSLGHTGISSSGALVDAVPVLTYQVPSGYMFQLRGVVCEYVINPTSTTLVAPFSGSGILEFRLDVNMLNATQTALGYAVKDFSIVTVYLGSFAVAPWPVYGAGPMLFNPRDILRWKALQTAGAGNLRHGVANCGLKGWLIPYQETQANG